MVFVTQDQNFFLFTGGLSIAVWFFHLWYTYLLVPMVHNWFKIALNQLCTISTIGKWFLLHNISTIRNGFYYTTPKLFSFYVCGGNQYPQRSYHLCTTCILCVDHNSHESVYASLWYNIRLRFDCIPSVITRYHPYMNHYGIISDYVLIVSPVSLQDTIRI